ncbi:MAG: hypothetical protein QNJ81_08285 [Acidimicrobiia bacterium]|nr:hypothetical protein [Acidimicrobiia bacterium]
MALRRSRGHRGGDGGQTKGFADRIATATKPEPSKQQEGGAPAVLNQGLTRYQRRTANLPSGATPLTVEERTNIVIDLRHEESAEE